jgi:hypothetical protein
MEEIWGWRCTLCHRKVAVYPKERLLYFWRPRGHFIYHKGIPLSEFMVRRVVIILCNKDLKYYRENVEVSDAIIDAKIETEFPNGIGPDQDDND